MTVAFHFMRRRSKSGLPAYLFLEQQESTPEAETQNKKNEISKNSEIVFPITLRVSTPSKNENRMEQSLNLH